MCFSKTFSFHSSLLVDGNNLIWKSRTDQNVCTAILHTFGLGHACIMCTTANKFQTRCIFQAAYRTPITSCDYISAIYVMRFIAVAYIMIIYFEFFVHRVSRNMSHPNKNGSAFPSYKFFLYLWHTLMVEYVYDSKSKPSSKSIDQQQDSYLNVYKHDVQ